MLEATLKMRESKLGPDHPDRLISRNNLPSAYVAAGRTAEAIAMHEATLKQRESKLGPDHPDTLTSHNNLANAYVAAGRTGKAIAMHEATLKQRESKLGPDHPETLASLDTLAHAVEIGSPATAEPMFRRALDGYRRQQGPDGALIFHLTLDLEGVLERLGRTAEMEPLLTALLAAQRATLAPDRPWLARTLAGLGSSLLDVRKYAEAEPILRECLKIREAKLPDDRSRFNAQSMVGVSLLGQSKYSEAEPILISGYEGMEARDAKIPATFKVRLTEAGARSVQLTRRGTIPRKPPSGGPSSRSPRTRRHRNRDVIAEERARPRLESRVRFPEANDVWISDDGEGIDGDPFSPRDE
jgi:tetratricopeptide (TPR) repeat protein